MKPKIEIFVQILDSVRQMRRSCKPPSRVMWLSDVYFGLSENIPGRTDVSGPSIINAIKVTIIPQQTNTLNKHSWSVRAMCSYRTSDVWRQKLELVFSNCKVIQARGNFYTLLFQNWLELMGTNWICVSGILFYSELCVHCDGGISRLTGRFIKLYEVVYKRHFFVAIDEL